MGKGISIYSFSVLGNNGEERKTKELQERIHSTREQNIKEKTWNGARSMASKPVGDFQKDFFLHTVD